ncbi:DMT family transporter [Marinobacterium rhizophilum]|uniref:DMT family transporter n=1 Tax=Marinobacterium rhizophilum TaxID=420402 RepID=A0ABY5HDV0_9GAMM|nr:DMT family transporter [Marinobacterium rhizophilum]UTW10512.1 DMT family transporter [Marinobacterium rhizophilum]
MSVSSTTTGVPPGPYDNHAKGMLIAACGVLVLSFDALLIRLADSSSYNVTFWRGAFTCLATGLLCLYWRKRQRWPTTPALWLGGIAIASLYGVNTWLFVYSISHTNTANTVVILASSPLFAALFSRLLLGERVLQRTLVAIAVSVLGVLVVFAGSESAASQWLGDIAALVLAASMGMMFTLLRRFQALPRLPIIAMAGAIAALISWPLATPLTLAPASYGWLALMGLIQIPLATILIMTAPRYLPSTEVSLFLLLETVLGPIWVWLLLGETTSIHTLVGGTAILGAISVNTWLALRRAPGNAAVA